MLMQIPVPSYFIHARHIVLPLKNMLIRLLKQFTNRRVLLVLGETLVLAGSLN